MRFFEITTKMDAKTFRRMFVPENTEGKDEFEKDDESRKLEERLERAVVAQTDQFWKKFGEKSFVFLVSRRKEKLTLGVVLLGAAGELKLGASDGIAEAEALAGKYLAALNMRHSKLKTEETSIKNAGKLIHCAYANDYLRDDDDTYELLGLECVIGNRSRGFSFDEYIDITPRGEHASKESLCKASREIFCETSLRPEIERIYQGAARRVTKGHPVHYVVRCDSPKLSMKIVETLFDALRANGRLQNGRISFLKLSEGSGRSSENYDQFYRVNFGGLVAVGYAKKTAVSDEDDDDDMATPGIAYVDDICKAAKKYRNEVLTVLCLPRSSDAVQEMFLEHLDGLAFIPIQEEPLFGEAAKEYLRGAAKAVNIAPNRSLYACVKDAEKGCLAADLDANFDRWFTKTLKDKVYPQYGELARDAYLSIKQKPKGSGFSELDSMTGLDEAKTVIKKAVNYYKAQKIFRDRGMRSDDAAMHMIFTGNPGSAKTTVARLFARIMKENGLLSRGDLVEVGRSDLVGRYVGWTAKIVRTKFREARGSVLFIDEAYSLVDDRPGSFGDEAINTIVQEMENNRKDMAVIFAGYPDKMEHFLDTNPGLRSRIAYHVPFADYSPDELYEILEFMVREKEMSLTPGVRERVLPVFESAVRNNDFGNGRFVRNIFEKAKMNQADRLVTSDTAEVTDDDVRTLLPCDFEQLSTPKPSIVTIGFAA
ncbi:MAG: AAA family ATPase [Synergistaceae bacterium]|jgi:AAA+ superfamily predicted ATPase|nr:AAA family ATPase [Synergistaceae bacterium]